MKKAIIITVLTGFGLAVLYKSGALESLVVFLLIGAIPGTNYTLPSNTMLASIACVAWALIFQIAAIKAFYALSKIRAKNLVLARQKRLPKRRFSRI